MLVIGHCESPSMGQPIRAWGVLLALMAGMASIPAVGDEAESNLPFMAAPVIANRSFAFEIPAQPLADALAKFGALTGLPVIFDAALVQGRRSAAVRGDREPMQALRWMLEGTGLAAQYVRPDRTDAMVVLRAPLAEEGEPIEALASVPLLPGIAHRRYDGLMQTRIRETFCAHPLLARGAYRTAVQFNIDAAGRVQGARLLDTSGDRARDAAIASALEGMRLDWSPPATMAQPVTLVIQPRGAGVCSTEP